jgi:hypothetical protein
MLVILWAVSAALTSRVDDKGLDRLRKMIYLQSIVLVFAMQAAAC